LSIYLNELKQDKQFTRLLTKDISIIRLVGEAYSSDDFVDMPSWLRQKYGK